MKFFRYGTFLSIATSCILAACSNVNTAKSVDSASLLPSASSTSTPQMNARPKRSLSEIDLTTIKHIAPKGRAQDDALEDENFNELTLADDLLAHGKDSIPFLIGKLNDETEMKRGPVDFLYNVYVGDVALIILNDFFTENDGKTSTIPGFSWDEFLERGNDKNSMGIDILRNYIEKHGRKNIQDRWQKMWKENKENIFWDKAERCFKLGK